MDTIPRTPAEYRSWWQANAPVPYGYCWCGCGQKTTIAQRTDTGWNIVKGEPRRTLRGHNKPKRRLRTPEQYQQFWLQNTDVPYGYCWCGCEQQTPIATYSHNGNVSGEPLRFVRSGHDKKLRRNIANALAPSPNPSGLCMCGCGAETSIAKQTHTASGLVKGKHVRFISGHGWKANTFDLKTELTRRYLNGESSSSLASTYGISHNSVNQYVRTQGFDLHPHPNSGTLEWPESEAARLLRRRPLYKQWRDAVFARDGRECTECGSTEHLQAHHIRRFADIVAEHLPTSIEDAAACEELWDVDNGVVLCKDCHRAAHFS